VEDPAPSDPVQRQAGKKTGTATEAESGVGAEPGPLDVLLLYEDVATGLRAWQPFDQLVRRLKLDADLQVRMWKFEWLREPAMRQQAIEESLDADIILLATHGHCELSEHVKSWFARWLALKPPRPRALVVSLDENAREPSGRNGVLAQLQAMARPSDLQVFPHFAPAPHSERELTAESIHRHADTWSELLEGIVHRTDPHQRWGINE
jgi:hypothetical protein